MPRFDVSVPHNLGREAAVERLKSFTEHIKQKMGDQVTDLEQAWNDDELTFGFSSFGFRISGVLVVAEELVKVAGELPFAAAMFKGKIVASIEEQLQKILAQ